MYFKLEDQTIEKIENRIEEYTEKIKPEDSQFDVEFLSQTMKLELESYLLESNNKDDRESIVEWVEYDIEETRSSYNYSEFDELYNLLSWMFCFEIAPIIIDNEKSKIEAISADENEVQIGNKALLKAHNYLFGSEVVRWDPIFEELKVYFPQYQKTHANSGCMVLIIGITTTALFFL